MLNVSGLDAFYGKTGIVRGATLAMDAGEIVGLLGRNGAGKTTLLKALVGLIDRRCHRYTFLDADVRSWPVHRLARAGLVLVPDDRGIFGRLSVEENLRIAERRGAPFCTRDAYALFPRLRARAATSGGMLSGGEQQMLALARGLVCGPRLLLLDEPTEGLAPAIVDEIVDALKTLRRRSEGLSILLVDQNVEMCLAVASRHYLLEEGRIVLACDSAQLRDAPDLQQRYLGVDAAG